MCGHCVPEKFPRSSILQRRFALELLSYPQYPSDKLHEGGSRRSGLTFDKGGLVGSSDGHHNRGASSPSKALP